VPRKEPPDRSLRFAARERRREAGGLGIEGERSAQRIRRARIEQRLLRAREPLAARRRKLNALRCERGLDRLAAPLFRLHCCLSLRGYDKSVSTMKREIIRGAATPAPMAHYSQGILAGETLYASGQIASDYKTGVPAGPDIRNQARYILDNLRSVFEAAGCGFRDVVKSQVFMTDLNELHQFDRVWKEFFPSPPPRTTVQVSGLLVPGCKVEIDLWGVKPAVKKTHCSGGILVGDTLYAAGQIASDYKTGMPPEARQDPAFPYYGSNIQKQARYVLTNLRSVFQAAGCDLKDVVKSQVFLTDLNDFHYFDQVWKEFFPSPPPRTTVQVSGLLVPGCRVEIDLWGVDSSVSKRIISGSKAPTPMAHYCQGILAGETLYAAGQIASDYKTGVPPEARQDPAFPYYGSDIQKQARYVLGNLRSVLEAAGCDLKDVVKSQVFLTDLKDFYYFDQVWKEFFPSPPPRTTVQESGLLVPGCRIEIDLTAVLP
jgi:reactive intermediate/imine deaminase